MWDFLMFIWDWLKSKFSRKPKTFDIAPLATPIIANLDILKHEIQIDLNPHIEYRLPPSVIFDEAKQSEKKYLEHLALSINLPNEKEFSFNPSFWESARSKQPSEEIEDYVKSDQEIYLSDTLREALTHKDSENLLVVTLSRNNEGKEQTIYLLGGQHITQSNPVAHVDDCVFSSIDCLCFEDIDPDNTSYFSYDELFDSATKFYGMSVTTGEDLFSFENEIQKRFSHQNPNNNNIHALEDRQATVNHFNFLNTTQIHSDAFLLALRKMYGAQNFDRYRNDTMVKSLQNLITTNSRILAAVGMMHLPEMIGMLLNIGFHVSAEEELYAAVPPLSSHLTL